MSPLAMLERNAMGMILAGLGLFVGVAASASAQEASGYAPKPWGLDTPAGRCVVCHSLEKGGPFRVAPNLWGIVGAEKGRGREYYSYSKALLERGGAWSADEISQFLATPSKFLPGTKKSISVPDAEERQRIIDFLVTLKD